MEREAYFSEEEEEGRKLASIASGNQLCRLCLRRGTRGRMPRHSYFITPFIKTFFFWLITNLIIIN